MFNKIMHAFKMFKMLKTSMTTRVHPTRVPGNKG
jgi:hypothetical protein